MSESKEKSQRRYELDWLRILVILDLIPFHAAWLMTHLTGFSHILKEGLGASIINYYLSFVAYWQMPLLFFLAGTTAFISLNHRSNREYVLERIKRLLVPLIFFVLVLGPLGFYFFPMSSGSRSFSDYIFRFWPHCLKEVYICQYEGRPELVGWGHLWFVGYLLVISLVTLPLLSYCKKHLQQGFNYPWTILILRKGGIFLPGVLFVLVHVILTPIWPLFYTHNLYQDWAYFAYHLVAFILGFTFCLDDRFQQAIDRHLKLSLPLAIVSSVVVLVMRYKVPEFSTSAYNPRYFIYSIFFGFQIWFWILSLLGLARRYLTKSNRFLAYFSRASYPFYILHLTLMVPIEYFIVQWRLEVFTEFLVFTLLSFIVTILTYDILVKRTKVTRFLFGMKL